MSVEDRVDGLRETSEGIASECDVTFELYRTTPTKTILCEALQKISNINSFICIRYIAHLIIKQHSHQTSLEHDLVKIPNTTSVICK